MSPKLPTITLDVTLAELYGRAGPRFADKRIAQVLCGTNSRLDINSNFPRNSKYLFQDSAFNEPPVVDNGKNKKSIGTTNGTSNGHGSSTSTAALDNPGLRRSLAAKYLSLIPQRDAFISGPTPVVLFDLESSASAHDRREAERTLSILPSHQQPELVFCPGPAHIPIASRGIDLVAYKLILDDLERYDLAVDPDMHWFVNSKAGLARSGLPTPAAKIVELDDHACLPEKCCAACREPANGFVVPAACDGPRGRWLEAQSKRVRAAIEAHPLPFVLKNQQTFGGAGTWIVRAEEDRVRLLDDFFRGDGDDGGILRRLLSAVTSDNAHLQPGSIILSELVDDPIGDYGLTFFVNDHNGDYEPVFLAASEQMTDGEGAWTGSTINYARQDELQRKFGDLIRVTAKWLRKQGYVGPAGIDVLESKTAAPAEGSTEGSADARFPHFHIVDLNARTSGSLCLPLLRGHFTSRHLLSAASFSIGVGLGRDAFVEKFAPEFESGEMCIISWYEDPEEGSSVADVAVGARDEEGLRALMKRVRDATDEITF